MKKTIYYRLEYSRMSGTHFVKADGYLDVDTDIVYQKRSEYGKIWKATDYATGILIPTRDSNTMKECQERVARVMDTVNRKRETPEYKQSSENLYQYCLTQY